MPRFRVCITRDTTESVIYEVEAEDKDAAEDEAWDRYGKDPAPDYEFDDWAGSPYVSDTEEMGDEDEDEAPQGEEVAHD